jgi:predicted RNA-binding Zn-ribbon protein involved in translation (DUF1610 family)
MNKPDGQHEITFTCPTCGEHVLEEIMVDITVSSECSVIEVDGFGVDPTTYEIGYHRGKKNEGGHVDRYQCSGCGFKIIDHESPHCEEGLDATALAKALKELANPTETQQDRSGLVSHDELVREIAQQYAGLTGEEMVLEWSRLFPGKEITYDGDSLYRWTAG